MFLAMIFGGLSLLGLMVSISATVAVSILGTMVGSQLESEDLWILDSAARQTASEADNPDGDSVPEFTRLRTAAAGEPALPTGGFYLAATSAAPKTDARGGLLVVCSVDNGVRGSQPELQRLIPGTSVSTELNAAPLFAIIQPGENGQLETDCASALQGVAAGDDRVRRVSVADGMQLAGPLVATGPTTVEYGTDGIGSSFRVNGAISAQSLSVSGAGSIGSLTLGIPLAIGGGGTGAGTAADAWSAILSGSSLLALARQNRDAVAVTGGTIDGTAIGRTSAADGRFLDLVSATGTLNGSLGATAPDTARVTTLSASGLATLSGGAALPDGTVAAPGLSFASSAATGLYLGGPDQICVATAAAGRWCWLAGGQLMNAAAGTAGASAPFAAYGTGSMVADIANTGTAAGSTALQLRVAAATANALAVTGPGGTVASLSGAGALTVSGSLAAGGAAIGGNASVAGSLTAGGGRLSLGGSGATAAIAASGPAAGIDLQPQGTGVLTANGALVWTAANDGAGSGLDADYTRGGCVDPRGGTAGTVLARDASGCYVPATISVAGGGGGVTIAEQDPKIASTASGSWCRGTGSQIACDQSQPLSGLTSGAILVANGTQTATTGFATIAGTQASFVAAGDGGVIADYYDYSSDRNLKERDEALQEACAKLGGIRAVTYYWNRLQKARGRGDSRQHVGLFAQDVKAAFPDLVRRDGDGYLQLDYARLVAPLIACSQEAQAEAKDLRGDLQALARRLQELETKLAAGAGAGAEPAREFELKPPTGRREKP